MGFRSALFPLGLGAPGQAGFRNPLPVPPLSGGGITQAGFRGPLPVIQLAGGGIVQAGFVCPIPFVNLGSSGVDLSPYQRMSLRDVQYEALRLVTNQSDRHTMEQAYWASVFGLEGTASDIQFDGVIVSLGYSSIKDYYEAITGETHPDHYSSEKAYWLKVISDNL